MATRITIRKPDDWHLHVRDGEMLKAALPYTAKHFGRAILMQALDQPLSAYRRLVISPCGLTEIDAAGARTEVLGVNATEHLAGL